MHSAADYIFDRLNFNKIEGLSEYYKKMIKKLILFNIARRAKEPG